MAVRRVVAGTNAAGKSRVISDEMVEGEFPIPTIHFTNLWGADEPPRFPHDGAMPPHKGAFPGPGGYRVSMMTLAPGIVWDPPASPISPAAQAELDRRRRADPDDVMEAENPGMHTSDTVDFEFVLDGEVSLELDDGELVHLKAGDFFVQNGTRHRWFNRGSVPTTVAVVVIGGHRRP